MSNVLNVKHVSRLRSSLEVLGADPSALLDELLGAEEEGRNSVSGGATREELEALSHLRAFAREDLVFAHCVPATDTAVVIFRTQQGAEAAEVVIVARGADMEEEEEEEAAAREGQPQHLLQTEPVPGLHDRLRTARPPSGALGETKPAAPRGSQSTGGAWVEVTRGTPQEKWEPHTCEPVFAEVDKPSAWDQQLELPTINPVFWMSSPPASPPSEWEPLGEDINRIPTVDLEHRPISGTQNVLLLDNAEIPVSSRAPSKPTVPSIVLSLS